MISKTLFRESLVNLNIPVWPVYVVMFVILYLVNPIESAIWVFILFAWGLLWFGLHKKRHLFGQISPLWFLLVHFTFILYTVLRLLTLPPVIALLVPGMIGAWYVQYLLVVPYLISKRHFKSAEQLLTFQQWLNPEGNSLKFQRVRLLSAQFEYESALEVVNQIIDSLLLKSKDPRGNLIPVNDHAISAYTARSHIAVGLKDSELAFLDAERVVRIQPEKASSYVLRGAVYTAQNKLEQAQADLDHSRTLNPTENERFDLFQQLSRLSYRRKDYEQALQSLKKALDMIPMVPNIQPKQEAMALYVQMGLIMVTQQKMREAWEMYRVAQSHDSHAPEVLIGIAVLHAAQNEWDQSLQIWSDLTKSYPYFASPEKVIYYYYRYTPPMADLVRQIAVRAGSAAA